jgi:hypothetical protein
MIYAYTTLIEEKVRLNARLKGLKETLKLEKVDEEVFLIIQEIESHIVGINSALKVLFDEIFEK